MITLLDVEMTTKREDVPRLRYDLLAHLYKCAEGIPAADNAHGMSTPPPFRIKMLAHAGYGYRVRIAVLDDDVAMALLWRLQPGDQGAPQVFVESVGKITEVSWIQLAKAGERIDAARPDIEMEALTPCSFRQRHDGELVSFPYGYHVLASARKTWVAFGDAPLPPIPAEHAVLGAAAGWRTGKFEAPPGLLLRGYVGDMHYRVPHGVSHAGVGAAFLLACLAGVGRRAAWGAGTLRPKGALAEAAAGMGIGGEVWAWAG